MDTKNDDSACSGDSIMMVDDVGQGEGALAIASADPCKFAREQEKDNNTKEAQQHEQQKEEHLGNNPNKKYKTVKCVGDGDDGSGSGGGGTEGAGTPNCSIDGDVVGGGGSRSTGAIKKVIAQKRKTEQKPHQQTQSNTTSTSSSSEESSVGGVPKGDTPAATVAEHSEITSLTSSSSLSSSTTAVATTTTTPNSNAFETKVKQISKNLKETTLAESANKTTSLDETASGSSSSSSLASVAASSSKSTSASIAKASPGASCSSASHNDEVASTSRAAAAALEASLQSANESIDENDHRSKKVRFHPDVKENDGGNRVIPKKKKKLKTAASGDEASASSQHAGSSEDEMELDEEEDVEEEEEFDLAKTIAEADDYLKVHPLTFVRPHDKNAERLQDGLLEEEDIPQLPESPEVEEDFYANVPVENGVECILGKLIKGGKVEYLLRYADRPGLFWESEEFICKQCPNLLQLYEQNRENRQQQLMHHVAERQNIRQRYTDF